MVRGAHARVFVLILLALTLGAALAGCGSGKEGADGPPGDTAKQQAASAKTMEATAPEKTGGDAKKSARTATVRLSGAEGTVYAGTYGNLDGSKYAEGLLEGEPVEFTVDLRKSGFDVVNASFVKPNGAKDGLLKIEILSGGKVVAQGDSENQYGALNLTWSSEG